MKNFFIFVKTVIHFYVFLFFVSVCPVTVLNNHESIGALSIINFPLHAVSDTFTKNIFAKIDAMYGKTGIDLDEYQITHFKKTYLYLIFLTKLTKVQQNPTYQSYKKDFAEYLKDNKSSLPHVPTAALLNSKGWNGVLVTEQDLKNSVAWQLYCKSMIADIYVYFSTVLQVIHNVEKQTFNYIPHFETSFYNADYTNLRTLNEMARTRLVIEESLKARWVSQCIRWSKLPTVDVAVSKAITKNVVTLEAEVIAFRATQFYKMTHDQHFALGVEPEATLTDANFLGGRQLISPLKEQIWCYYMIYEASGQLTSFLNQQNLDKVLQICSSTKLQPNIFPYKPQDYVLLDELLSVKSKAEGTHVSSIHPLPKNYKIDEIRTPDHLQQTYRNYQREVGDNLKKINESQVKVQMWSFFKDLGHDFSKAFDDVKSAVEAGVDAVKNFAVAAAQGVAGIGAELVGAFAEIGGDDKITDWANAEFSKEAATLKKATTDLTTCVDDFASSLKDGFIAPYAELQGDLVGFILDDAKIGQDISKTIDQVADTLVDVAATSLNTMDDVAINGVQGAFQSVQIGEQLAITVADAAWAIFSTKGRQEFLAQGEQLGKECLRAVTEAYSTFKGIGTNVMKVILTGLGTIVNAITTLFIDLSREVTYLFTGGIFKMLGLGSIPGFKQAAAYAQQTRDHVTSVLEAHRSTINDVMGVVACIAADAVVTVGTAGAGTAADVEIDASIMGAAESASEEAATASEEAASLAAESDQAAIAAESAQNALNVLRASADATEDEIAQAQEVLDDALSKADQAEQTAADAATKATKLEKLADLSKAAGALKQNAVNAVKQSLEDSKSFAQQLSEKVGKVASEKLENLKMLASSIPKTAVNIFKSNDAILQAAQDALDTLPEDATPEERQAAQKAVDDAQKIVDETKLGKLKRYGSNVLKTLGHVFSPIGMIMNVTFNMGMIIGGANQDAKNELDIETQSKTLNNLWAFNNSNKIAVAQQQLLYLEEMQQKVQAQVANQTLSLTMSQNTINANILNLRSEMAALFAPLYVQLLTPDAFSNLLLANIGTSWKLKTDYVDLYPSQGFFTTTTGRSDFTFAQEIAQAPETTNLLLTDTKGSEKLWFNQRCTARDIVTEAGAVKKPEDPLFVQVDMQMLYTLNSSFHAGLYLGGNYHDYLAPNYVSKYLMNTTIAQIQQIFASGNSVPVANIDTSIVDFDEAHLAKMVVLYRDSATSAVMLGVYEHEGLGWLLQTELDAQAQFDEQHRYTLQATLNTTELEVKLFVDGQINPIVHEKIQVTALQNQRTYGMICSGVAMEWNQITPKPMIDTKNRSKKIKNNETAREQVNKLLLAQMSEPKFGLFKLTPLSKQSILLGQYLYATSDTDLKKILPKSAIDFVMFAVNKPGRLQLGVDPITALQSGVDARLVSVINGVMYDAAGKTVGNVLNAWTQFQTSSAGPFSDKLDAFIKQQQADISTALTHVKFGDFWKLDVASVTALSNGLYLYTTTQTLKDAAGKPMLDYMVFAHYTPTNLMIGMPPTATIANALFSFVSGNVYSKNIQSGKTSVLVPWSTSYQGANLDIQFGNYASKHNLLKDPLFQTIIAAQTAYGAVQAAGVGTNGIQINASTVAQSDHFAKMVKLPFAGSQEGYSSHAPGIKLSFGKRDFDQRQQEAAGNAGYQLYGQKKGIKLSFGKNK
ncbi:hypothetical protein KBB68_02705 [Candidatus Babeliales bacterium]|nr:hypothetical protein [Candidatus Babeliales bacterium]